MPYRASAHGQNLYSLLMTKTFALPRATPTSVLAILGPVPTTTTVSPDQSGQSAKHPQIDANELVVDIDGHCDFDIPDFPLDDAFVVLARHTAICIRLH